MPKHINYVHDPASRPLNKSDGKDSASPPNELLGENEVPSTMKKELAIIKGCPHLVSIFLYMCVTGHVVL